MLPVVAIIGILKAGAAFALVEENYAPERIEYIKKDCGCKSEINRNTWEEILKCEPLDGHEQTDDHDAAYAIYTSGTTGNPKGVLHEYGTKNSARNLRGRFCLSKQCAVFLLEMLCNGRDNGSVKSYAQICLQAD